METSQGCHRLGADCDPDLKRWLNQAVEMGGSDLHVISDVGPVVRLHGDLQSIGGLGEDPAANGTAAESIREKLLGLCPPDWKDRFLAERNLDFAFDLVENESARRFRANYFFAGEQIGACFRVIPDSVPELDWANFPQDLAEKLTGFRNGMILFSGVAGSGKSTSLAMLIQRLISMGGKRIVTIEDPIEYRFVTATHQQATSLISQREVRVDVASFADGLRFGLRQDPDVILVGEIRDRETAQIALSAAETGHLVLSTLHTRDAKGAISRYVDLFDGAMQNDIRSQLALALRSVVSQHLLPSSVPGNKRELALEVLFNNSPMASAIRMGKLESIDNNIQTGRSGGMVTLDESIRQLMRDGAISEETARHYISDEVYLFR